MTITVKYKNLCDRRYAMYFICIILFNLYNSSLILVVPLYSILIGENFLA